MQTDAQKALYWELEQITESVSSSKNNSPKSWLAEIWQLLSNAMTPSNEPKVWRAIDRFGHISWRVYLPMTGQIVGFSSEEEVRIWLEANLRSL